MKNDIWEKGWLEQILNQAEQAVQSWPSWMQKPELRYPMNRPATARSTTRNTTESNSNSGCCLKKNSR